MHPDRVIHTAMSETSEVCRENGLTLDELTDPHRLSVRGIDQQGVERAANMIRDSIAIAKKEEMAGMDAAAVEAPRAGFGERLLTKIIKHACG